MLHINDLTYRIEGRPLFQQATLAINEGSKVGLVGRNGTGKSTLFRLIKGEISLDDGSISLRKNMKLGVVDQEVPSGPQSLIETVLSADKERKALLSEAETATDPNRIAAIHTRLSDIEAYSAEARAGAILSGLGFDGADQLRPCSDFSGGWRMRVALAAMLFAKPDMLLLDEPTNYLDVEGAVWLESHVRSYPGTAFIISHDRDFLNRAVTHIAHLRGGKLFSYTGGYDQFEAQLAEQNRLNMSLMAKQEDERRALENFVTRYKAQASKAKQAQSRMKRLEKMKPVATIISDPIAPIHLPGPERSLSPPIIRFDDVSLGYGDTTILRQLNQRIDPDDRIGLLGKNGQGKSTFAKAIMGQLDAQQGFIKRHKKLEIGYFAQHQVDALNPNKSAYDHVVELMPEATEAQRRARLASFGLGFEKSETKAGDLSGGEKARLLFSLIGFHNPHLLVLDEPTNNLDIDSRAELMRSLNNYSGAVLLISHDRSLLEMVVDRLWLVDKGRVTTYEGSLEDYRALQLEKEKKTSKSSDGDGDIKKLDRKRRAEARAEIAPLKKKAQALENQIDKIQRKIVATDKALSIEDLFTTDPEMAIRLAQDRASLSKDVELLEGKWLTALEAYEIAKTEIGLEDS
ncbi:ATP-binding cassette subfamily F protein 3 [Litorimonas taeanensis]|uniref:ATP-binding cassette subfamily F protein 3 n=1 Tax=Litorimonas taeanensis TaxID=568099 RepID=A0A420WJ59_9PROT|nr:ABC-F family ATP-binding cassette domain-containing protein [Litorimonas taeanensis]RKQ70955.1 ATP-binding cassette subfamily F protein 3 [Litorimonas taeanensis]